MANDDAQAVAAIAAHEARWHKFVAPEAIAEMVEQHEKLVALGPDIEYMVDDFYGEKHRLTGKRPGGRLERYDSAVSKIENGGVGLHLSPGAWVAIAALITTLGAIAVALVGIAFGEAT